MADPEIRHESDGRRARYVIATPEGEAELTLSILSPDLVIADHTAVPKALEGKGHARALFNRLVEDARAQGFRIVPLCPYINARRARHPELAELFSTRFEPAGRRFRFGDSVIFLPNSVARSAAMISHSSPLSQPAVSGTPRRWREALLIGGLIALVAAGLAGLAAATGWEETMRQLRALGPMQIGLLLALSVLNYLARGLRWHLFARRLGLDTRLGQNLRHFLGGFAMSVTPARVGELIRMRWLRRETGWPVERTAPLVLMDRASDLAAMALILALSLALAASGIAFALPVVVLALAASWVATRPRLLSALVTLLYRATGKLPRPMARVRGAARSLSRFSTWPMVAAALVLGLLGWAAEGYALHLLLVWMGADIGIAKAVAIFTFSTLAGGLTGAPGGLGGAEAAMIALLTLEGVPLEVSVPATAIIRVTTLWFAILIGLAVFPMAERASLKGAR